MSSPAPDSSTPYKDFVTDARAMIGDVDPGNYDVADEIWTSAMATALRELQRYLPLRAQAQLVVSDGDSSVVLPSDFLQFDYNSLDQALFPVGVDITYRSYIFALMSTTGAASNLDSSFFGGAPYPFATQTQFNVQDDGDGGKLLTFVPSAIKNWTAPFQYVAAHTVNDDPENPINTVPDDKRDIVLYKMSEVACRAIARILAGADRMASQQYRDMAADFKTEFERRTRFKAVGFMG